MNTPTTTTTTHSYRTNNLAGWKQRGETRIPGLGSFSRHELAAMLSTQDMRELYQLVAVGQHERAARRVQEIAIAYRATNEQ